MPEGRAPATGRLTVPAKAVSRCAQIRSRPISSVGCGVHAVRVLSAVIEWEFRRRQPGELRRLLERSALAALGVVDGRRLGQLLVRCAGDQGDDALMAVELVVGLEIWYRSTVSAAGASPLPGKEEKRA